MEQGPAPCERCACAVSAAVDGDNRGGGGPGALMKPHHFIRPVGTCVPRAGETHPLPGGALGTREGLGRGDVQHVSVR